MDRVNEGNGSRQLALDLGSFSVVPPTRTRVAPWEYGRAMCRLRNEVDAQISRLQGDRRIVPRIAKLDVKFRESIGFSLYGALTGSGRRPWQCKP